MITKVFKFIALIVAAIFFVVALLLSYPLTLFALAWNEAKKNANNIYRTLNDKF